MRARLASYLHGGQTTEFYACLAGCVVRIERHLRVQHRLDDDDTQLAVAQGGCDFLGSIAGELELLDAKLGQLITPYPLSRLIAEMTLHDPASLIAERGFITLHEPASGAGGMIIAAADVLETKGFDPRSTLDVEALDVAALCFKMTYLQLALRGVPATVRHANTLSLEIYESAHTPRVPPVPSPAWRRLPALAARSPHAARPAARSPTLLPSRATATGR